MTIGRLEAASYGVQYVQGPEALDVAGLAAAAHEVLILEPLNLAPGYDAAQGAADVAAIQAGGKQVFLYMTVGESSDIRRYWDAGWTDPANARPTGAVATGGGDDVDGRTGTAPSWLSDWISGASGGAARLVRFWDPEWLAVLQDEIDFLLGDLGADGLFLDNVASYFEWITFDNSDRAGRPDVRPEDDLDQPATFYASAMADLVGAVSAYVQANHPGAQIIANGNPFLPFDTGDRAGKGQLFLDSISAMLQEGVYHSGGERYDNAATQTALTTIVAAEGIPILALDYIDPAQTEKIDLFAEDAARDGFLPYADELDLALDGLQPALNQPTSGADRLYLPADGGSIDGLGGDDEIFGGEGPDAASGGPGDDTFFGGAGDDVWRVDADRADAFAGAAQADVSGPVLLTLNGGLGVDELHDVQFVAFADETAAMAELLNPPGDGPDGVPSFVSVERLDTPDRILVTWRVDNAGDAPLPASSITVQMVDAQGSAPQGRSATVSVEAIPPGGFDTGSAGFTLAAGVYTPRLRYDASSVVAEFDEGNNVVDAALLSVGAVQDLELIEVSLSQVAVGTGSLLQRDIRIENTGATTSLATRLIVELVPVGGGPALLIQDTTIAPIAPATGILSRASVPVPASAPLGDYVVRVTLDPFDQIEETDETNDQGVSGTAVTLVDGRPDLEAAELQTVDATLVSGGPDTLVDFTFAIENVGLGAAQVNVTQVSLVPEGGGAEIVLESLITPVISAGGRVEIRDGSVIPGDIAPGVYRWKLTADAAGGVTELDESNNVALSTGVLTVTGPPANLSIDVVRTFDAEISRSDPQTSVGFAFFVVNDGDGTAAASRAIVELTPQGGGAPTVIREVDVPALGPGERFGIDGGAPIPPSLAAGVYSWRFVVDADGVVSEVDEADNAAVSATTLTMTEGAFDLAVASLVVDADGPLATGESFDVTWTVRNDGVFVDGTQIVLAAERADGGGFELARVDVPALGPGQSVTRTTQVSVRADLSALVYDIVAVVDPNGAIDESDEDDNTLVAAAALDVLATPNGKAQDLVLADATLTQGDRLDFGWTLASQNGALLPEAGYAVTLIPQGGGAALEIQNRLLPAETPADGSIIAVQEMLTLSADLAPGDYLVRVEYDPLNQVAETDETDNVVEASLTVAGLSRFSKSRDVVNLDGPGVARAGGGNDVVRGGGWNDEIFGEGGADRLIGRGGKDELHGGPGRDDLFGGGGRDKLYGGPGKDDLFGGGGPDQAWGGGGDDFLDLGGGRDTGWGGGGADEIEGGRGDDALIGGGGQDALFGGAGKDKMNGGRGADQMKGGSGRDVFIVDRNGGDDEILDFGRGRDRVDLRDFDFDGIREVLRRLDREGRDTELDLPGRGELTFAGVRPGQLDADDFLL